MVAAGLTWPMDEIIQNFEQLNPQVDIEPNYAGSHQLAMQILYGGNADVFASANLTYINNLKENKMLEKYTVFAKNKLVIIANKELNRVHSMSDLAKEGIKLSIGTKEVPVGSYTRNVLSKLSNSKQFQADFSDKVFKNVITEENNVKTVLSKVLLGEVDAGIVYQSDVSPMNKDKLVVINIPEKYNIIAEYPVAVLNISSNKQLAEKFVTFLSSQTAQKILKKHGLIPIHND